VFGQCLSKSSSRSIVEEVQTKIEVDSAGISPSIPISEAARRYLAIESAEQYVKQAPKVYMKKT